jgi:ECF sigma factor
LVVAWGKSDERARDELMPLVYRELHKLARHRMASERPDNTLQTTELINEAYLQLVASKGKSWQNRSHFYAVSA